MFEGTPSVLDVLGLDADELEWQDLSLCANMDTNLFYDQYESSSSTAKMVDDICLSCPVMKQCLEKATDDGEWGVWGGIYLTSGKADKNRNSHKTEKVWLQIKERIAS